MRLTWQIRRAQVEPLSFRNAAATAAWPGTVGRCRENPGGGSRVAVARGHPRPRFSRTIRAASCRRRTHRRCRAGCSSTSAGAKTAAAGAAPRRRGVPARHSASFRSSSREGVFRACATAREVRSVVAPFSIPPGGSTPTPGMPICLMTGAHNIKVGYLGLFHYDNQIEFLQPEGWSTGSLTGCPPSRPSLGWFDSQWRT